MFKEWNIRSEDYFEVDADALTSSQETNVPPATAMHLFAMQDPLDGSDNGDCGSQHDKVPHNEALDCVRKLALFLIQTGLNEALAHKFREFTDILDKHLQNA